MARKLPKPANPESPESPDAPAVPAIPDAPAVPAIPTTGNLPTELNLSQLPQINSYLPTNLFDPNSSPVPRTTTDQLQQSIQIAAEQKNSIKLAHVNLDNFIELAKLAVKQTKLVKLGVEYRIGLEEVAATNQKLVAAQVQTANEGKKVSLKVEEGRLIDEQIVGAQIKTTNQSLRNDIDHLETNYLNQAKPVVEQTWSNKLDNLKQKAIDALGGA